MNKIYTGNFPKFVIKAFDNEDYVKDFLESGIFIVRELRRYKNIENAARRDATEGDAHFQYPDQITSIHMYPSSDTTTTSVKPGMMKVQASLGNPILVYCTSLPDIEHEYLKEKFGKYLVKIEDPIQLAVDMHRGVINAGYSPIGPVRGGSVKYTKGLPVAKDLGPGEGSLLSYIQKPKKFCDEHEFRFASVLSGLLRPSELPDIVKINLGEAISYAKQIA